MTILPRPKHQWIYTHLTPRRTPGPYESGQATVIGEIIWLDQAGEDPTVGGYWTRDRGASIRSTSGFKGQTYSSDSTDFFVSTDGHVDASKVFNLGDGQRLAVGGFFQFDDLDRDFDSVPALGIKNPGSIDRDIYTLAGIVRYDARSFYMGGGFAGNWGNGTWKDNTVGAVGDFDSNGFIGAGYIGNVFTLTKSVSLDLNGFIAYDHETVGGFTDSTGFRWSNEEEKYWDAGGRAKLFMTIPDGNYVWMPYVAATLQAEFDYSHELHVPAQLGAPRETLFYGDGQTLWGGQIGVDAVHASGIKFGLSGFWEDSSQYELAGGWAYFKIPTLSWLFGHRG